MSAHAPRGPRLKRTYNRLDRPDLMDAPSVGRQKCEARSKQSGERCKRWPIPGGTVCVIHGGKAPQAQAAAKDRLMALQNKAVDTIAKLLDADAFPTVQLGAAKDVLDRTEGKAAEKVAMEHSGELVIKHELADD